MGAWSGRGVMQTEAFISTTGTLRVQWETRNEDAAGKGAFSVMLHSGVSGRSLASVVEHHGAGRDTAYVSEDPREFFFVVDAKHLDWSVDRRRRRGGDRPQIQADADSLRRPDLGR